VPPRTAIIDLALVAWFALTALSVTYVLYDAFRRTPEMPVMKWGWVLVTLYTGPVGAAIYVLSCQEPSPGAHEAFVRPLWKQALGSTIHCLAGDATGIIVAAAITMALGLRMWQDLIAEYAFGFAFGLLVFQALFMRDMLGGSYTRALRLSFLPEWISMNAVMSAMIPVMVVLMTRDMRSMEPGSTRFWGVMSLATLAGFVVAYPFNAWLVAAGLKHGMGTVRALGEGGHAPALEAGLVAHGTGHVQTHPAAHVMAQPVAHSVGSAMQGNPSAAAAPTATMNGTGPAAETRQHAGMPRGATPAQIGAVTLLSVLALAGGVLIAALSGDLTMSGRMAEHDARAAGEPASAPTDSMPGMRH
jgi:hypothetical protein